jgi:thiazole synthase ThiGH ThiG subunit
MPPGRLAGLPGLKADVFVVDDPAQGGPLTADTLLVLCAIEAATQKPVLVGSGLGLGPGDVKVLHDHGVDGVLVTGGVDVARAFMEAAEALSAL